MNTAPRPDMTLYLPDETATERLGIWLAPRLQAGDCLLLEGPIGAGKSHLARAIIRARLGRMEDVPSPSFTLVQSYEAADVEIWHADLYRLSHPDEALELGLDEAFGRAITLIEWPERLGNAAPPDAIRLRLSAVDEGRQLRIALPGHPALAAALAADWGADG